MTRLTYKVIFKKSNTMHLILVVKIDSVAVFPKRSWKCELLSQYNILNDRSCKLFSFRSFV